jgi:hypothetical protein
MAMQQMFSAHKAWEDWASMGLGLLIVISPWLAQTPDNQTATVNAMTVGALVIFIGALDCSSSGAGRSGASSRSALGWWSRPGCSATAASAR